MKNRKPTTEESLNIAQQVIVIETLESRGMDDLDFTDLSVWQIKEMIELAFQRGQMAAK